VCPVLFIVCLYTCVCECLLQNNNYETKHKNNANCRSAFEFAYVVVSIGMCGESVWVTYLVGVALAPPCGHTYVHVYKHTSILTRT